ncbi:hypothetical protein ABZ508_23620 [Streptomyces lavendulocolor]|uniref:Uncharacterized protein n=1 Tax=Streptomyces lavendulocolor TaxID=67316 RepID=A0ABV2W9Y6_9ACTN
MRQSGSRSVSGGCASCGSARELRVVAVRDGEDVLACPGHAALLAAPFDDRLSALAWYQSRRPFTSPPLTDEASMSTTMTDGGKHGGEPSDKPWTPPPTPPSPDGSGPSRTTDGS